MIAFLLLFALTLQSPAPQTDPQLAWGVGLYDAASDPFLTEDPQVEMMLNYCASTGVLTQARADQIYAEMIAVSQPFPA